MLKMRIGETPSLKSSKIMLQKFSDYMSVLFSFTVCVMLLIGWRLRRFELITSEYGIGHRLGILGTSLMLAMFIYPLRKRIPALRAIGSVKMWFRIHMIFGILGPLCILFHATFHLGSLNSSIALFSMLVIAASGIVGRYFYGKIHYGLYGQRATLLELRDNLRQEKEEVRKQFALIPGIKEELLDLSEEVLNPCTSLLRSIMRIFSIGWRTRFIQWKIKLIANVYLKRNMASSAWTCAMKRKMKRQMQREAHLFLSQSVSIAQFSFFERLFALWQVLHIPSVYILVLVILVHVIAVKMY